MSNQIRQKFYNLFWSNEGCRDIFTLHKEELLFKEEGEIGTVKKHYYHKRFVISNSLKLKKPDPIERIEHRLENRTIDLNVSLQDKSDKNLPETKIVEYIQQKFGRPIKTFSKKLNGNRFTQVKFITEILAALASEKRLISFLHKYEVVPKTFQSIAEIFQWVDQSVEQEMGKFLKSDHFADIFSTIDEVAHHYNNFNYRSLIDSHNFYTGILYDKENFNDRLHLLDCLYESNVLQGGVYKAFYECTHCEIDVFSGSVTLKVKPSKAKLKCPNCGKDVFYLVPYKIQESIFEDIISKDGLLSEAIAYLLTEHKLPFTRNVYSSTDREVDFVVFNSRGIVTDIFEVKMFKVDRPDDVLVSNMSEGLRKFIATIDKLKVTDVAKANGSFHYITNIDDEELMRELRNTFKNELRERTITIHNSESIQRYIESLEAKK